MFSLTAIADLGLLNDSGFATALGGQVLLHALPGSNGVILAEAGIHFVPSRAHPSLHLELSGLIQVLQEKTFKICNFILDI